MTGESVRLDGDEVPFGVEELFFSRTNPNGIIEFGNATFQRVSIYGWDELIGRPHKIVRHPDTPRAVFWLLWQSLLRGEPIGAYVKNRAKDGRFYWVYAVATPIEGGFLSVRLKPTSALFPTVRQVYEEMVAAERTNGATPEESAAQLLQRLKALGFRDYAAFMAAALRAESDARAAALQRRASAASALFAEAVSAAQVLPERAATIFAAYAENEYIPMNFQVLAAQLGREGAALSVVSNNYRVISDEMRSCVDRFSRSAAQVLEAIQQGSFLTSVAELQHEVGELFKAEAAASSDAGMEKQARALEAQSAAYRARSIASLSAITRQSRTFANDCGEMGRLAAGLEVTRIMGKVECARHTDAADGLSELLAALESFQKIISASLKEIEHKNDRIGQQTVKLLDRMKEAA